ncbi:MAG: DJ-1/PfpI family protein [Candidatus Aenigmatarchaeota archaeon]
MKLAWFFILMAILVAGCVEKESMPNLEGKKVLMIVAPNNFRDEELLRPKEILEKTGAEIKIASKGVAVAKGMLGSSVSVDLDLSEVEVKSYDAIIFVGGTGAQVYFDDTTALKIAREAYEQGKVVGAICIAPSILANAGILENKKATAWPSEAGNLKAKGASYTGELVTVDGKIITAKGPEAASQFGKVIAEALM